MANEQPDACLCCGKKISDDCNVMICVDCGYGYHLGSCSGISESVYKKKGDAVKKNWQCATCKVSKTRGGQASRQKQQEHDVGGELAEINRKLDEIASIKEKVEKLMCVKDTVDSIEKSVQHISEQYDEILKDVKRQAKEITDLKKRVEQVELRQDDEQVRVLKKEVNDLEQYSRRQNLEIRGLPLVEREDLLKELNGLARELELKELSREDLEGLHRLPSKPGRPSPVLARFVSRVTRDQWMEKRSNLRSVRPGVLFLDNLTARNKKLLWLAKTKATDKGYQFTWQKNGKVFVRKCPGEPIIRIESENDLVKIT